MKNNKQDRQNPEEACGVKASGVTGGRGKDKGLKAGKLKYVYRAIKPPAPSTHTPIRTPTHIPLSHHHKSPHEINDSALEHSFSALTLLTFCTRQLWSALRSLSDFSRLASARVLLFAFF